MNQLSSGLSAMRQLNLVHRDLKPQNLLLTSRDCNKAVLKIGDFGFARYIHPQGGMAETLCGSPLYMAPEILMMNKYDAKADLWSVGAIMFEMLAGRPPFLGSNHLELLRNIEKASSQGSGAQLPAKVSYKCSPKCKSLLRGLLQRRPVSRISYEELFTHPFFEGLDAERSSSQSLKTEISDVRKGDTNLSPSKHSYIGTENSPVIERFKFDNNIDITNQEKTENAENLCDDFGIAATETLKREGGNDVSEHEIHGDAESDACSSPHRGSTELLREYVVIEDDFGKIEVEGREEVTTPMRSALGFPAALASQCVQELSTSIQETKSCGASSKMESKGEVGKTIATGDKIIENPTLTSNPPCNGVIDGIASRIAALEAAGEALSEAVVPTTTRNAISPAHAELSLSLFAAEIINAAMSLAQHLPQGQGEPRRRRLRAELQAALNRARRAGRTIAGSDEILNSSVLPNQVAVAYDAALGFIRQGAVEELVGNNSSNDQSEVNNRRKPSANANASYARAAAILSVLRDEGPSLPLAPSFRPDDNDLRLLSRYITSLGQLM